MAGSGRRASFGPKMVGHWVNRIPKNSRGKPIGSLMAKESTC